MKNKNDIIMNQIVEIIDHTGAHIINEWIKMGYRIASVTALHVSSPNSIEHGKICFVLEKIFIDPAF